MLGHMLLNLGNTFLCTLNIARLKSWKFYLTLLMKLLISPNSFSQHSNYSWNTTMEVHERLKIFDLIILLASWWIQLDRRWRSILVRFRRWISQGSHFQPPMWFLLKRGLFETCIPNLPIRIILKLSQMHINKGLRRQYVLSLHKKKSCFFPLPKFTRFLVKF
jgi:hypothetical protein